MTIEDYHAVPVADLRLYMTAFRGAIRQRNENHGRRHFCHLKEYRARYLETVLAIRRAIKGKT